MRINRRSIRKRMVLAAPVALAAGLVANHIQAAEIIELTQTPCQFLEIEDDYGFVSKKKADCDAINARTGKDRLAKARVLELKPGEYIFRVTNKNVPYELGFWLRSKGYNWRNPLHKITKTSISGGGLMMGQTQEYKVVLEPGEYVYSCPLNTTPDYKIKVK